MNKIISWIIKNKLKTFFIILGLLFLLIGIPLIINRLYASDIVLVYTEWGAKEVLAFYGSVLTFIGTTSLGVLSLYQNSIFKKSNENKEKLTIRPYLFTSINDEQPMYLSENTEEYVLIDFVNDSFCIKHTSRNTHSAILNYTHKKKEYDEFLKLPEDEKEHAKHIKLLEEQTDIINKLQKRFELVRYEITNAGHGNAIKINMTLNNDKLLPLFCLPTNSSKEVLLLFDFNNVKYNKEFSFKMKFSFYDVENNGPYYQEEVFYISKNDDGNLSLRFKEQISSPHENKEDTHNANT